MSNDTLETLGVCSHVHVRADALTAGHDNVKLVVNGTVKAVVPLYLLQALLDRRAYVMPFDISTDDGAQVIAAQMDIRELLAKHYPDDPVAAAFFNVPMRPPAPTAPGHYPDDPE